MSTPLPRYRTNETPLPFHRTEVKITLQHHKSTPRSDLPRVHVDPLVDHRLQIRKVPARAFPSISGTNKAVSDQTHWPASAPITVSGSLFTVPSAHCSLFTVHGVQRSPVLARGVDALELPPPPALVPACHSLTQYRVDAISGPET
eukprot:1052509-Rhodomonas_salina.1